MPSERIARVIERLLNEAEVAAIAEDWAGLQASADEALGLDPANPDALALSDFGRTALVQVKDFSGVDAADATSTALRELGLERDQVEVRVVTRGHKGHWFLGGQLPALIRVSYRQPSNLPEGSPVSGRSARVADAILDQAETSVAERDWDRALTLVGYVKRLDAENADASALRNLIESRQHSGPGEAFTGTLPSNLVQALDPGNADADSLEQPAEPRAPVESEAGVVTATSDSRGLPNKASQLQPESPTDSSGMSFGQAVSSAFDNYANFDSRASRAAYWYWGLFTLLLQLVVLGVEVALGSLMLIAYAVACAVLFLPSLTLAVRRLHDVNKTGWNLLWAVVPLVGPVYLFVLSVTEGTQGPNKYGAAADE